MTKQEIVTRIAKQTGMEKTIVMTVVEAFMENVKEAMIGGNEVFLRGFGSLGICYFPGCNRIASIILIMGTDTPNAYGQAMKRNKSSL